MIERSGEWDTPESKSEINVVTWRKNKYESNRNRLGVKKDIARHFVRGHWRLQPYPSGGDSKLIWINTLHTREHKCTIT